MDIEVRSFAEMETEPGFAALVEEYYTEAGNPHLPRPKYDSDKYRFLCKIGVLHTVGAYTVSGILVGFALITVAVLPKYSIPAATIDAVFVRRDFRMSNAGVQLLEKAEKIAIELAGGRLFASAPANGALVEVLPRLGYVESNIHFFKQCGGDSA